MDTIAGLAFLPLEITKDGRRVQRGRRKSAIEAAASQSGAGKVTDLFVVMSHGWEQRHGRGASASMTGLFTNVAALASQATLRLSQSGRFAIVGVLWPSKKFADSRPDPVRRRSPAWGPAMARMSARHPRSRPKLESLEGSVRRAGRGGAGTRPRRLVDGHRETVRTAAERIRRQRSARFGSAELQAMRGTVARIGSIVHPADATLNTLEKLALAIGLRLPPGDRRHQPWTEHGMRHRRLGFARRFLQRDKVRRIAAAQPCHLLPDEGARRPCRHRAQRNAGVDAAVAARSPHPSDRP